MAGAESSFAWDAASIPDRLLSGTPFTSWDEETIVFNNIFRVDQYGFFLYWRVQDEREGNCVELSTVSEVRPGYIPKESKVRDALLRTGHDPLEERMLTVVYNSSLVDVSFIHLCASNARLAKEWLEGLLPLLYNNAINNFNIMAQLFKQYIKAGILSTTLGKISVKGICKALNAGKLEQSVLDGLRDLGLSSGKNDEMDMNFENFYQLYLKVCPRLEIDQLCVKWGGGRAPYLTVNQLVKFLNEEQRDPRLNEILYPYYDKEKALALIKKYEKSLDMLQRDRISVNGLTRYLLSEDTSLLKSDQLQLMQDMNQPLSHYFINSSHNTYLIGRQFGGKSSVEMYRQCLIDGCRCIELDCWDGPNDEPLITHGNAMCTKILFKDVIEAIRDSAFVSSDYPVILSFENHCSKQQQYKMASYCLDILGDALVTKQFDSWPLEEGRLLPSPNQLRGRILIKNKKLKPEQEAEGESSYDFSDLESMCATLRRDSGNLKETAIVDDNIEEDNKEQEEEDEDKAVDEEKTSDLDTISTENKPLSTVELNDLWQFSSRVTSEIIERAASAVMSKNNSVHNVYVKSVKQCHTVSEFSYLLKTMEDPGLENGLDVLDSSLHKLESVNVSHYSSSDYFDKVDDCNCSDCEGEPESQNALKERIYCVKCGHYVVRKQLSSTGSSSSLCSIDSDSEQSDAPRNASVTVVIDGHSETNEDQNRQDDLTPTPSPLPSPATTPTKDNSVDPLSLFTGVTDSQKINGNADITNNNFTKSGINSTGRDSASKMSSQLSTDRRDSDVKIPSQQSVANTTSSTSSSNGTRSLSSSSTYSQSSVFEIRNGERKDSTASVTSDIIPRKESIGSSNSIESTNEDEDEERDVVGPFLYKQDKMFGSSLRLNAFPKKGSRSASLTPDEIELISNFQSQNTTGNINPFLSSLVNYIQPVPFQGFEEAEEKDISFHMSSFNESTGFQLVKTSPQDFVKYNKRQLSRIYPKGSRVDSSNYNPQVFWNVGSQMVSLNFQTPDLAFQLNQGKFEMNGSCGYILKPDLMIRKDRAFDPFTESVIDGCVAAYVAVKVISGQFLSDKKISTLVEVDMYGLPTDTLRKKYKTKMATSKGLNTVYEEEEFVFRRVVMPELALLRFGVVDDNDKVIAQRILPLNALQSGYRHVPLRTETGYSIPMGTLFVHITLRSYVPEGYGDIVDELSEPIKYRSAAEKRASQMMCFEMDEPDDGPELPSFIKKSTSDNALSKMKSSSLSLTSLSSTSSTASLPQFNSRPRESIVTLGYMGSRSGSEITLHLMESNVPKKHDMKHAPISQEELKRDKTYRKALKRQQKENEAYQKKYTKERNNMQKTHTYELEQLITGFEENKQAAYKTYERATRRCGDEKTAALKAVYEKKIQYQSELQRVEANKTLARQTEEWTTMIDKQIVEEMEVYERQSDTQMTLLTSAMEAIHEVQSKDLMSKHDRENIEIKKRQTKQSIDSKAKLLMGDKAGKSKEERERKQRQFDNQIINKFKDERMKLEGRQSREIEELKNRHEEEKQNIEQEMKKTVAEKLEEIRAKGEKLRKAIRSPYQTLLPSH